MVIMDTDLLSMFAKVDAIEALLELIGGDQIGITPAIAEEIAVPLQYGYGFPQQVLSNIPVVAINQQVAEKIAQLRIEATFLGRGEREAIAFCQIEQSIFATNDIEARRFAQSQRVAVMSLQALLRGMWVSGMKSQTEVKQLLERIKQTDRLKVSMAVESEIFAQENVKI